MFQVHRYKEKEGGRMDKRQEQKEAIVSLIEYSHFFVALDKVGLNDIIDYLNIDLISEHLIDIAKRLKN